MAKWAARLQLVMSDSVPVTQVEKGMIKVIPDIICLTATNPSDPAASEILSDGCGLMCKPCELYMHAHAYQHLD